MLPEIVLFVTFRSPSLKIPPAFVDQEGLRITLGKLEPDDPATHLRLDLAGRNPDDAFGDVAYEKGYLFFRLLEQTVGREAWDPFLRDFFDGFAFSAVDTDGFVAFLNERLIDGRTDAARLRAALEIEAWIDGPGLPGNAPKLDDSTLVRVRQRAAAWAAGSPPAALDTRDWTTHHWIHFIRSLPDELSVERLAELDAAFGFTTTGNAAVLQTWLLEAVTRGYGPADAALERFLIEVGRLYFIRPLYEELVRSEEGRARARRLFTAAGPGYHPLARRTIEEIVGAGG